MKSYLYTTLIFACLAFGFTSCQKDFLKKPQGSDTTVDSVFSTSQKSLAAISQAYAWSLSSGITLNDWDNNRNYGLRSSTLSHLSGEVNAVKFNWEDGWMIQRSGMTADDGSGIPISEDGFNFNYKAIRHNHLIMEHIDQVGDMSAAEKSQVKAEMAVLNAYRYQEMLKRYGGVPIVTSSLSSDQEIKIGRSTVREVLQHIISLCDNALAALPNSQPREMTGRVTKGVALAIKAEALMYAARPLFNSSTPYLDLPANKELVSLGSSDPLLWDQAVKANQAVIDWGMANGHEVINTGSPLEDYGTAVGTPGNSEVLLAYKAQFTSWGGNGNYYDPRGPSGGANGMSYHQLRQYYKADGTDQEWPSDNVNLPYSDYATKIEQMEARYKASAMGAGIDAWNNPNNQQWSSSRISGASNWEGTAGNEACGRRVKFWYRAGSRNWFEFPIYRMAEFYLNLAEAYNELGNPAMAHQYLHTIRNRAGLPDVTETNKDKLRKIIQREWAAEFYEENTLLFHVKHWKLDDIDKGIIGGPKRSFIFTYVNGKSGNVPSDYINYSVRTVYTGYWNSNQYLTPFPIREINKGYIVQNPGY